MKQSPGVTIGERVFLSEHAMIDPAEFHIGDNSYVGAHSYITDHVHLGENTTVNPFTVIRGRVHIGDAVRIGAHTSIIAFNHSMHPDEPVYKQKHTVKGITIGDDVWIGSNVTILDGVTVGSLAVLAAGAIVTKDVAGWSIVGGNPARHVRDRREVGSTKPAPLAAKLTAFGNTARQDAPALISRCWDPTLNGGRYADSPGAAATVRAHCDAIELARGAAAGHRAGTAPPRRARDPFAVPAGSGERAGSGVSLPWDARRRTAHLWCRTRHLPCPVSGLRARSAGQQLQPPHLRRFGHARGLSSGVTEAAAMAEKHVGRRGLDRRLGHRHLLEPGANSQGRGDGDRAAAHTLFGWLLANADAQSGVWGDPGEGTLLQVVNGYYRLTRGTFAQFGLPVPHPEKLIDTVPEHAADPRYFAGGKHNACNVLDVAHPLWLARKQVKHREAEIQAWAREQLEAALAQWTPGAGMPFSLAGGDRTECQPGLQGTEMWLAIIWYLADLLGESGHLGYKPRGVHRPEPAFNLAG